MLGPPWASVIKKGGHGDVAGEIVAPGASWSDCEGVLRAAGWRKLPGTSLGAGGSVACRGSTSCGMQWQSNVHVLPEGPAALVLSEHLT